MKGMQYTEFYCRQLLLQCTIGLRFGLLVYWSIGLSVYWSIGLLAEYASVDLCLDLQDFLVINLK